MWDLSEFQKAAHKAVPACAQSAVVHQQAKCMALAEHGHGWRGLLLLLFTCYVRQACAGSYQILPNIFAGSQSGGIFEQAGNRVLDDVSETCDVDAVQVANQAQLHPILHDLVHSTFFRLFRVGKPPQCPFWKKDVKEEKEHDSGSTCAGGGGPGFAGLGGAAVGGLGGAGVGGFKSLFAKQPKSFTEPAPKPACSVDAEEESSSLPPAPANDLRLDRSMTDVERIASIERDNETDGSCEFEEDLPTYWQDMCRADVTKGSDVEDINLVKNPERNTGYNGSHIWQAMYNENCFEVGNNIPRGRYGQPAGMCYEERVLYRLLSGWHASTSISIYKNFFAPGTKVKGKWSPNPERYMESLGQHPDRVKNLHFSFVVMLRAVKKAAPFLNTYSYSTGNDKESEKVRGLMARLLDSQVLSLCSPLFDAFDETRLFRNVSLTDYAEQRAAAEQRSRLKRQFKSVFQNITVLVDCVQCQRCRLHAKLFSLGLGSALKILLTPQELIPLTTSRDEVVALVNTLWKLSESMEDAKELTRLYADRIQSPENQNSKGPSKQPLAEVSAVKTPSTTLPPPVSAKPAPSTVEVIQREGGSMSRNELLDIAMGAVKRATKAGALTKSVEEALLRAFVLRKVGDEVLMLAKYYAADSPELFASLALEAAAMADDITTRAPPTTVTAAASGTTVKASASTRPLLGSAGAPADAVIIGGGLAGMVTAMSLLDRGAQVVLVDKQPYLGGNSGKASSGINAALETSVESLIKDTTKSAGVLARPGLIEKLAQDSANAVSWLMNRTTLDLSMRSQLGGHTAKRTLRPANAFVGAEVTFAFGKLLNKIAEEKPQQFRLLTKTKWTGLQRSNSGDSWLVSVIPAGSTSGRSSETLQAAATVITSGGFGHDTREARSYLIEYRPDIKDFPTTLGSQTTGDGIKIAQKIGAKLVDMDRVQLHPTGFVDPTNPQDHSKTLAAELLRGVGGLILDRTGMRFTDELGTRQAVVNAMLRAAGEGKAFKHIAQDRSFALVLNGKAGAMADRHSTLYSKKGLLTKVNGLQGVATHLKVDEKQLVDTFEAYNKAAERGMDNFNRTVFPAGHWPIESTEEFFVGYVTPVIHYTMGGIAIDTDGRVLREVDNQTIPGLFAAGEASGGVHGDNRLAGNSLLECTVFGRHLGLTLPIGAAARVQPRSERPDVAMPITESHLPHEETSAETAVSQVPAAEPQTPIQRSISKEELRKSKTDGQHWVSLYGDVYDLSAYVEEHPGGPEAITDVAGSDGTETFETVHNRELLEAMGFEPIGKLAD